MGQWLLHFYSANKTLYSDASVISLDNLPVHLKGGWFSQTKTSNTITSLSCVLSEFSWLSNKVQINTQRQQKIAEKTERKNIR